MRRCTTKDFEDRGYNFTGDEGKMIKAGFRLCPDREKMDYLKIGGGYTDLQSRKSFSLEIHKCNKTVNVDCKDDPLV